MDNMKKNGLGDEELSMVSGGATVVEIKKPDAGAIRCFNCNSSDVEVEQKGAYVSVTCKKCGAVDMRAV